MKRDQLIGHPAKRSIQTNELFKDSDLPGQEESLHFARLQGGIKLGRRGEVILDRIGRPQDGGRLETRDTMDQLDLNLKWQTG